jgi:thiol-disulfide isomerase/thioredoxin
MIKSKTQTGMGVWRRLRANTWAATAMDSLAIILVAMGISAWQHRDLLPSDGFEQAPPLVVTALGGETVSIGATPGVTTVVYFFAPWCHVCHASFGNLEDLRQQSDESQLRIVAVALDYDSIDEVHQFLKRHTVGFPVALGSPAVSAAWRIRAFPTYYVLDEQGRVTGRSMGYSTTLGLKLRT